MENITTDSLARCYKVADSIKKNIHLLTESNAGRIDPSMVGFNNHVIISECKPFLEAVQHEIGGEIINDSDIGTFLYCNYADCKSE